MPTTDRLDYATHLKYVQLIARLSEGVTVVCTEAPQLRASEWATATEKTRLIELTAQSIRDEGSIVAIDEDYSVAAVLWLPIKAYYLLYHTLCILDCLITGRRSQLRAKHSDCIDRFSQLLKAGTVRFSEPLFNQVFDASILDFQTRSGEHLRSDVADDILYKLLMKKVAKEKLTGWRYSQGLTDLRDPKAKARVAKFKSKMTVSIFDFFYQMRLRLNYRDFNFVDDIPASDIRVYFDAYFEAASHVFKALKALTRRLVVALPT